MTILEQANRIYGQNLLHLGLAMASARFPRTRFLLLEPPGTRTPLFGASMSFDVARDALRFGYSSTRQWLEVQGGELLHHLLTGASSATGSSDVSADARPRWGVARGWRQLVRLFGQPGPAELVHRSI